MTTDEADLAAMVIFPYILICMGDFDYSAPAELFMGKRRGTARGRAMTYKRFPTSAEAINYAVGTLDPVELAGAVLVVGDERYEGAQIQELYEGTR
jgi:hypothetical protein